jgi:hypothetical protein
MTERSDARILWNRHFIGWASVGYACAAAWVGLALLAAAVSGQPVRFLAAPDGKRVNLPAEFGVAELLSSASGLAFIAVYSICVYLVVYVSYRLHTRRKMRAYAK